MTLTDRYSYPEDYTGKCEAILDLALNHVPVYMAWKHLDPGPGTPVDERFDALPALTKNDIRENFPTGLMPEGKDLDEGLRSEQVQYTYTSGTTSEKVVNIWDQDWWNRSEAASWKLNSHMASLTYPQKQAKLASALNVGVVCEEDLPMSHRILGNTLYLNEKTSVMQWQPRHMKRMVDELNTYKPVVLEANPSLLARLSYWIIDNGVQVYSPAVIVFTFEYSSAIHLDAIGRVFSSALVSSYGTTETGFVMQQCECGLMHQNAQFCRIDFIPLKEQYGGPGLGRIFVTTFDNPWNIIIRFDVGDLIRLHTGGSCSCERTEGMVALPVEGRIGNCTFTTGGGLVTTGMLDGALSAAAVLRDYRLQQRDRKSYLLEVMLSPWSDANAACMDLHGILSGLYGSDGEYDIQILDSILTGPAGKFRRTGADFVFDEEALFQWR